MNESSNLKALKRTRGSFELFARNGRWGTCCDCPYDGNGRILPELCRFTERYDHNLILDDLVWQHKNYIKEYDRIK